MKLILLLIFLIISNGSLLFGQQQICLKRGSEVNSLTFDSSAVNNYLNLGNYKVVFYGEQHNNNFDPEIKYHLITDLNQSYGFRHIFMEIGFSESYLYNRYLETGDSTLLSGPRLIFTAANYLRFWKRLYEFNRSVSTDRKLVIHGVDFERTELYKVIHLLAPAGKSIPDALKPVMDTIAAHLPDPFLKMYAEKNGKLTGPADNSEFKSRLKYIQTQFLLNAATCKAFFGDNYPVLESIINNNSEVTVKPLGRNKSMFENMERIIRTEGIKQFIGFFGAAHVHYHTTSSLVNRADELPGIASKDVINIVEAVYNIPSAKRAVNDTELKALNTDCKATILPASAVPGYEKWADFIIVADDEQ